MLPVLLLVVLAAIVAAAVLVVRRRRPAPAAAPAPKVLAAAVAPAPRISGSVAPPREVVDPLDALDALLAELESTTLRIDGADELDERSVAELEGLAARLEAAAATFAAR